MSLRVYIITNDPEYAHEIREYFNPPYFEVVTEHRLSDITLVKVGGKEFPERLFPEGLDYRKVICIWAQSEKIDSVLRERGVRDFISRREIQNLWDFCKLVEMVKTICAHINPPEELRS